MSRQKKIEPLRATLHVMPSPETLQAARVEGRAMLARAVDEKIDQLRADAQALETAAKLLRAATGFPVPHKAETVEALWSMAAGMRLAADRMPDSREIPF